MSVHMLWPVFLAIFADIFYQVCSKSMPETINPFASLTITYLVGAAVSLVVFFITSGGQSLLDQWKEINWTAFILGLAIVGLEAGSIYMYRAGWNLNTGYIVKAMLLSIALIGVGYFLYKEQFTLTKAAGVAICLVGLILINK